MSLLHWLFPEKCVLCGKVLERDQRDLCDHCRVHAPECPILRAKYPFIHQWTSLWYYEDLARKSLLYYKFYGNRHCAVSYARLLGAKLERNDRLDVDMVTWIPVSKQRRRRRGFDQVQLLAEKMAAEVNLPAVATLKKIRHNRQQSTIVGQAQRRANVLGVYSVIDPATVAGKRILLLDDIVTTGATAGECARVLLTAGAKEVHLAVVAAARHHK